MISDQRNLRPGKGRKNMNANSTDQASTAIEELFSNAITKVHAEAFATAAEERARAEIDAAKAIARIKAEAESTSQDSSFADGVPFETDESQWEEENPEVLPNMT